MARPTPYDPEFDFSQWQAAHPTEPLPGASLDQELNDIALAIAQTQDVLNAITRDDAEVANKKIHWDGLDDYLRRLLNQAVNLDDSLLAAAAYAAAALASAEAADVSEGEAEIAAENAHLSESAASGAAQAAADSAVLAQNSANTILQMPLGTKFYATKADMDADLAPAAGTGAVITNDPTLSNDFPAIWRKTGAAGVAGWGLGADRLGPIEAKVKPTDEYDDGSKVFGTVFTSLNDMVGGGFDSEMNLWLYGSLYTQGGSRIEAPADPTALFEFTSADGKVALRISTDGLSDYIAPTLISGGSGSVSTAVLGADIVHIVLRGQSLWQGADGLPLVSTTDLGYGGLMFGGYGVRTWGIDSPLDPTLRPDGKFALAPLVEGVLGSLGETIASGLVAQLKDMIVGHYKAGARNTGQQILVSFPDQGGRFLDEISKVPVVPDGVGAYYPTAIDDVVRAKAHAALLGKSYAVLCVDFGQGEANGNPQMVRGGPVLGWQDFTNQYSAQLRLLRSNMETDIKAITAQPGRIDMVSYETEGALVAGAQIAASKAEPGLIQVVGPHYDTPTALNSHWDTPVVHGNEVHRSADGYRHIGCRHGKWIARQWLWGERIRDSRILQSRLVAANQILVDLVLPRPPVVIDTTWFPQQTAGMGFSIWSGLWETATLSAAVVTKVEVAGPSQLLLTFTGSLPVSPNLHYCRFATTDPIATPLVAYQDGAGTIFGYATKELVFSGSIKASLQSLVDEGAFYANNNTAPRVLSRALIIRSVVETGGQTKLVGQVNEVAGTASFLAGDIICPMRGDPYGNIRDSDEEYCPLTFGDNAYGTRFGKNYPMWNWLSPAINVEIRL